MKKEPNLLFDESIESSEIPWIPYILGSMVLHIVAVILLSMLTSFFPKKNHEKQVVIPVDVVTLKTKDTAKNNQVKKQKQNKNILENNSTKKEDSELGSDKYIITPPENIPTFSELEIPKVDSTKSNNISTEQKKNINTSSLTIPKEMTSISDNSYKSIYNTKTIKTELNDDNINEKILNQKNQMPVSSNNRKKTGNINYVGTITPESFFTTPLSNNKNTVNNNSFNDSTIKSKVPSINNSSGPIFTQINSNQNRKNNDNRKNQLPPKIAGLLPDPNAPNLTVSTKTVRKQSLNGDQIETKKSAINKSGILANLIDHRGANSGKDIPDSPAIPRQTQLKLIDANDVIQSFLGNGGEVVLKVKLLIDAKGRASVVQSPQVLKGALKGDVAQLVRNMMENWRFKPAQQRGQSVESLLEVTIQLKTNSE